MSDMIWIRWTAVGGDVWERHLPPDAAAVLMDQLDANPAITDAHVVTDPATEIGSHLKLSPAQRKTFDYAGAGRVWWQPSSGPHGSITRPSDKPGWQRPSRCTDSGHQLIELGLIRIDNYTRMSRIVLTDKGQIVYDRMQREAAKR